MASDRKPGGLLWGLFGYKRTPAAQMDGGMGEYVFQQFQTLPPQNVVEGRGFIPRRILSLTSPTLFVFAPATPPYDVTKVPVGIPDAEEALIEEEMLP